MKCSAILVNYHCADQLIGALLSLASDPACDHIHVVDNSVSQAEAARLRSHLPAKAALTVLERNLGFARACNLAFAADDSAFVLLLNPDARLLPGALARLKRFLAENPRAGGVGPRVFWDDDRQFLLPPTTLPSPMSHFWDRLGMHFPAVRSWRSARFRRRSLREWQAATPLRVNALSGGHVLLRRSAVEAAGGLFDPDFFMYWEDSDLMRRLARAGHELWLEPRATAVHHYQHSPAKDVLLAQGWPAYASKHFAAPGWRLLDRLLRRLPVRSPPSCEPLPPPESARGIEIAVPESLQLGWLLEFSPSPDFVPAIGHFGAGPLACLPAALAARFQGRDYYLRLGALEGGGIAVQFTVKASVWPA